jgi:hypothetical protein
VPVPASRSSASGFLVGSQHLLRQRTCGHPITAVDRRNRTIQKLIDRRRTTPGARVIDSQAPPPAAHVNIASLTTRPDRDIGAMTFPGRDVSQ